MKKKSSTRDTVPAWVPENLGSPATRALAHAGIRTLSQLSKFSQAEILRLHGVGPTAIPKLRKALKAEGLSFARKKVK